MVSELRKIATRRNRVAEKGPGAGLQETRLRSGLAPRPARSRGAGRAGRRRPGGARKHGGEPRPSPRQRQVRREASSCPPAPAASSTGSPHSSRSLKHEPAPRRGPPRGAGRGGRAPRHRPRARAARGRLPLPLRPAVRVRGGAARGDRANPRGMAEGDGGGAVAGSCRGGAFVSSPTRPAPARLSSAPGASGPGARGAGPGAFPVGADAASRWRRRFWPRLEGHSRSGNRCHRCGSLVSCDCGSCIAG